MRARTRAGVAWGLDALLVALLASASVVLERLRGLDHAAGDLVQMFIPSFAWWWSRPRWLGGWNPWVFGGFPANADPLVGHLHPLGLLWAVFSPLAAAAIEGAASPTIAGLGMLVYLRTIGCGRAGSLVGALSFAGAGFVHSHAIHPEKLRTVLAIPWALAALESLRGLGLVAGFGATVAVMVAGGHPQTIAFALAIVLAYALWMRARPGRAVVAGLGLGLLVPLATWLPAVQLILRSSHSETIVAGVGRLTGACMSTLVVPFACGGGTGPLYGTALDTLSRCGLVDCTGYPGMLVLLLTIAGGRRVLADRRGRFWIGAAAVGLVLSTGLAEQLMPIPGVRAPARALLWWSLGTAAAAGIALGRPRSERDATLPPLGAWLLAAAILGLAIAATTTIGPVARRASMGSLAVLVVSSGAAFLAARRRSAWGSALLVVVLAVDLVVLGDTLHAGLPRRGIARLREEFGAIRAALPPPSDAEGARGRVIVAPVMPGASWASLEGVRSLQGWNVLVPKVHARLLGTDAPGQYEFGFVADPALLAPRNTVLDLLRVRLLVVSSKLAADPRWHDALADPRWRPVRETASWRFFANDRARPVAWLVHAARATPADEALDTVHGRTTPFDPSLEALLTTELEPLDVATTPEAATVDRYDDDTLTVRVESSGRALLVTSELAYPGWQATIDGTPVPIHPVDGGLRAVVVRAGVSTVVFRYRPLLGRIGLAIGAASAALLVSAGILALRRAST